MGQVEQRRAPSQSRAVDGILRLAGDFVGLARVLGPAVATDYAWNVFRTFPEVARNKKLLPADRLMRRRGEFKAAVQGKTLFLPGSAFPDIGEMFARNVYLRPPNFAIRAGTTVVDLGCNWGMFSLLAAKIGAHAIGVDIDSGYEAPFGKHAAQWMRSKCDF